jgi:hypothetical protein
MILGLWMWIQNWRKEDCKKTYKEWYRGELGGCSEVSGGNDLLNGVEIREKLIRPDVIVQSVNE